MSDVRKVYHLPVLPYSVHSQKDRHNTRNFMPYSSQMVCGFLNVPQIELINMKGVCEMGPPV